MLLRISFEHSVLIRGIYLIEQNSFGKKNKMGSGKGVKITDSHLRHRIKKVFYQ